MGNNKIKKNKIKKIAQKQETERELYLNMKKAANFALLHQMP